MRRELLFASRDDALFTNNKGYIFIVRRLGEQSKLILSRSDSISNLELNLKIHGPCGPDAHAGADLQAFLIFCYKPILLSAHKLILLVYGDNTVMDFTLPRMLSLCAIKAGCGLWCLNEAACTCNWMIQLEKIKGKTYSSKTKRNHRCAGTTTTEQAFDPSICLGCRWTRDKWRLWSRVQRLARQVGSAGAFCPGWSHQPG